MGDNDIHYCCGALDPFFNAGESVPVDLEIKKIYRPLRAPDERIGIKIFSSTKRGVEFVDDCVTLLGTINVQLPVDVHID